MKIAMIGSEEKYSAKRMTGTKPVEEETKMKIAMIGSDAEQPAIKC